MAKATVQMPDDLLKKLSQLGDRVDEIAEMALEAGGKVALDAVRSSLNAAVGKGTKYPSRATGELERSLGLSMVRMDRDGNHNIKVGFSEPRSDGSSNAKLANIIEYGRSGQPPKPFLKPASTKSKATSVKAMTDVLEREVYGK